VRLAVECAGTLGGDRVAVWVDGEFAGATSGRPALAPFLLVGTYGISGDAPMSAHVDDLRVSVGASYAPVAAR
jgi:hypothetical protein